MRVDALLGAERVCIGDDPDGFPCSFGALVYFSWHRVLLSATHHRSLSINPVSEARSMNAQSQRCKVIMLDPESGGELQSWIVELPAKLGRGIFADISIDHPSIIRRSVGDIVSFSTTRTVRSRSVTWAARMAFTLTAPSLIRGPLNPMHGCESVWCS